MVGRRNSSAQGRSVGCSPTSPLSQLWPGCWFLSGIGSLGSLAWNPSRWNSQSVCLLFSVVKLGAEFRQVFLGRHQVTVCTGIFPTCQWRLLNWPQVRVSSWTGPSSLVPKDLCMSVVKQHSLFLEARGHGEVQKAIVQMLLADPVLAYGCLADWKGLAPHNAQQRLLLQHEQYRGATATQDTTGTCLALPRDWILPRHWHGNLLSERLYDRDRFVCGGYAGASDLRQCCQTLWPPDELKGNPFYMKCFS